MKIQLTGESETYGSLFEEGVFVKDLTVSLPGEFHEVMAIAIDRRPGTGPLYLIAGTDPHGGMRRSWVDGKNYRFAEGVLLHARLCVVSIVKMMEA